MRNKQAAASSKYVRVSLLANQRKQYNTIHVLYIVCVLYIIHDRDSWNNDDSDTLL